MELYNEKIYDLLSDNRQPLTLKEENGRFIIKELQERPVLSEEEGIRLLQQGAKNRQVASTNLNQDSSRSHTIVTFKLVRFPKTISKSRGIQPSDLRITKFSITDLAGSERQKNSGTTGTRFNEAIKINQGLTNLKRCIQIIQNNQTKATKVMN